MTTATRTNDEVVSILSDLLENSRDGEYGFRACADEVDDAQIKQVFASRSAQCAEAAAELATLIRSLGGETDTGAPPAGRCIAAGFTSRERWARTARCPCSRNASVARMQPSPAIARR